MALDLFGFTIEKKSKGEVKTEALKQESFVSPDEYDGSYNSKHQHISLKNYMGTMDITK